MKKNYTFKWLQQLNIGTFLLHFSRFRRVCVCVYIYVYNI